MKSLKSVLGVALAACSLMAITPARADDPLDIQLSYTVTTAGNLPAITNIVTFNSYASGGTGSWWASTVPANSVSTTIADPFWKSSANAPIDALMLGLVQDLPGDAPGQKHMVLMMSEAAATAATSIAWGTLFTSTNEATLIGNLEVATSGQDWPVIEADVTALYAFANGDARVGVLGPGGLPIDSWFSLGGVVPGATTTGNFTVLAFSDGQVLGQGVASLSTLAPVPEPGGVVLLLVGLLTVATVVRRRVPGGGHRPAA